MQESFKQQTPEENPNEFLKEGGQTKITPQIQEIAKQRGGKCLSDIYVNNRKLISGIIESVQISDKHSVMKELDKLDKIGEDNVYEKMV